MDLLNITEVIDVADLLQVTSSCDVDDIDFKNARTTIQFIAQPLANLLHSFIHSGHFYSAPSSSLLLRGAPEYSTDTVSEFHAEAHRQLQVKDLPKVSMWRLKRESNPRPSGCKLSSQPRHHHILQAYSYSYFVRNSSGRYRLTKLFHFLNLVEKCIR